MKHFAATAIRVKSSEEYTQIHDSEWDLVVSFRDHPRDYDVPHALKIGAIQFGHFSLAREIYASELRVQPDLPAQLTKLVERTLLPTVSAMSPKRHWTDDWYPTVFPAGLQHVHSDLGMPLLTAGPEEFYIAFWDMSSNSGQTLVLPRGTLHPELWLGELISVLQQADPDRFPAGVTWRDTDRWATIELREARDGLRAIEEERQRVLQDLSARELAAEAAIAQRTQEAEGGWWRLITADGDALVKLVIKALEVLEFDVEDRDSSTTGARLEDLRIKQPEKTEWVCLAEVKGTIRGASSGATAQIAGNPVRAYMRDNAGREPDKLWYIVNAQREKSPDLRGPTFSDPQNVLSVFADQQGLVIDTLSLFRAIMAVLEGTVERSTVRRSLTDSNGLWSFEAPNRD